jgi:hypothetical protein
MNKTEHIEFLKNEIEFLKDSNFIIKENIILKKLLFEHADLINQQKEEIKQLIKQNDRCAVLLYNLKESCQEKRK